MAEGKGAEAVLAVRRTVAEVAPGGGWATEVAPEGDQAVVTEVWWARRWDCPQAELWAGKRGQ